MTQLKILLLMICLVTSACNVSARRLGSVAGNSKSVANPITQPTPTGSAFQGPNFQITNITETKSSDGKKKLLNFTFPVSTSGALATNVISSFCSPGPSCLCRVVWTETNTTTPGATYSADAVAIPFVRTAYTQLSTVQSNFAQCEAPGPYQFNEIGLNQEMQIDIVPAATNAFPFTTNKVTFKRPSETIDNSEASFMDIRGNKFRDVWRYTCHEKIRRGAEIGNASAMSTFRPPQQNDKNVQEQRNILYGSSFSVRKFADDQKVPATQQNYFNLYIPFNNIGNFTPNNNKYSCPKVLNGPRPSARAFPMDSTFALAGSTSNEFKVPVEARSRLARSNDSQNNRHELCGATSSSSGGSLDSSSLLNACLGYAAPARADGGCGSIIVDTGARNADGSARTEERKMYRLRRFNAVYPPMYDSNGAWVEGYKTQIDQIYVLDRPAMLPGNKLGSVYGPKPCPYAWYDRRGTTGSISYLATNNTRWIGRNPDGLNLPVTFSDYSCPAVIPYAASGDPTNPMVRIKSLTATDLNGSFNPETSHLVSAGAAILRPIQSAWEPLYLEDTDFKACAPESEPSQRVDAPVHQLSFTNQTASYCAEVYPNGHRSLNTRTGHATAEYTIDTTGEPADALPQAPLLAPIGRNYTRGDTDTHSDGIQKALFNQTVYGCRSSDGLFPRSGTCCTSQGGHQVNCAPPTN